MNKWVIAAPLILIPLLSTVPVQAGTAAYYATCHFLDRGNDNGGSVSNVPCYAVEGGNVSGMFFHILWQDGVKTRLSMQPGSPLRDEATGRTYTRVDNYTFSADVDGDVITLDEPEYTDDRYNIDAPALLNLLQ